MNVLIKTYDFFSGHKKILWTSAVALTSVLVALVFRLGYNEDISDFLPLGTSDREALNVYQSISGADRLYILFSNPGDPDLTVEAITYFTEKVAEEDSEGWCSDLTAQFDMSSVQEVTDFVYENIPYFLTAEDYERMDSLLCQPGYLSEQIERDRQMLMFPTGGFVASNMVRDPLGLFSPVLSKLRSSDNQMGFEMYDGYIFTPDMSRAVAMMSSPFGNSETENNSKMLALLQDAIKSMESIYPGVSAHVVGGPEIAVGNASRIKTDSVIAIALAAVLIVLLLVYSFNSFRNILLILLSIGWGWLFALGGMSLFLDNVSIIVIGISSVILGIAVNYPLHLVAHTAHEPRMRVAIGEIMMPLVVGNITTVGAFLALVPLQSTALRDLGLFASLLLAGTILFVLLYLPHMVKIKPRSERKSRWIDYIASFSPEKHKALVGAAIVLTAVLAVFSFRTEFDSNIANMNYMTKEQKEDMQYFQSLMTKDTTRRLQNVYVLSSGKTFDEALEENSRRQPLMDSLLACGATSACHGVSQFLVSKDEQKLRLEMWDAFVERHHGVLTEGLASAAAAGGFSDTAFSDFSTVVENHEYTPQDMEFFEPLTRLVFSRNVTTLPESGMNYVVSILDVEPENVKNVEASLGRSFDVVGMNSALSDNLSSNFNYIGWACSLIVFFFLWFSFGRLELAIIAFLPMAVSWIWILGIMAILGIKFNIVNIILATFIFGQGDDYTIFMTEGCQHEYAYRRPILQSYKGSILQSALIMFIGIGTLIVAKHPAMRSLAQVTIIGMFSVVLMSYMIPPLLFKWLTTRNGIVRPCPLTLAGMFGYHPSDPVSQVRARYIYKGVEISRTATRNLRRHGAEISSLDLAGKSDYLYHDGGYGELAILLALLHPDVHVKAVLENDERCRVAQVAADSFVSNIEFTTLK